MIGPDAHVPKQAFLTRADPGKIRTPVAGLSKHPMKTLTQTVGQDQDGQEQVSEVEGEIDTYTLPLTVNLRMRIIPTTYEKVHNTLGPFRRNRDIFVCMNSGYGHTPAQWDATLKHVLDTRCFTLFTAISEHDNQLNYDTLIHNHPEAVTLIPPTPNAFGSMHPDIPVDCVHEPEQWAWSNGYLFAVSGVGQEIGSQSDGTLQQRETSWWSS
jgi:hypothetical protein